MAPLPPQLAQHYAQQLPPEIGHWNGPPGPPQVPQPSMNGMNGGAGAAAAAPYMVPYFNGYAAHHMHNPYQM